MTRKMRTQTVCMHDNTKIDCVVRALSILWGAVCGGGEGGCGRSAI